jgi:hypothetical protein
MPGGIQRRILASEAWRASDLQGDQGFESSNNLLRALVCNPYEIHPRKARPTFLEKKVPISVDWEKMQNEAAA